MASMSYRTQSTLSLKAIELGTLVAVIGMMAIVGLGLAGGLSARLPHTAPVEAAIPRPRAVEWRGVAMPPMPDATGEAGL